MSRSFKKVPGYVDRNPWAKRYANHVVRQRNKLDCHKAMLGDLDFEQIPNGKKFKNVFCSYTISDYSSLYYTQTEINNAVDNLYQWSHWTWMRNYYTFDEYVEKYGEQNLKYHFYMK